MFVTVLVRRLKPGKTYEDFVRAWYPDRGFGFPGRGPFLARNIDHPNEILAYGLIDLSDRAALDHELVRVTSQEAARHDRIAEVIESTVLRGAYELTDEFDFSTDDSVARGRPRWL
jgi:hypothetical protein